jgi:hypothetical protein
MRLKAAFYDILYPVPPEAGKQETGFYEFYL